MTALAVLLSCAALSAPAAPPGGDGTASEHFARGQALFESGDYDGALEALDAAVSLDPQPRYFYNIALVHEWKGDYLRARRAMEGFLRRANDGPDRDRARVALERYRERSRVGRVVVRVTPPGAQVQVDGMERGTTPLPEALELAPGERRVRVQKKGFTPWEQTEVLVGGQLLVLDVSLGRVPEGQLRVDVRAGGARVALDGRVLGTGPLSHDVSVPPGAHQIRVERPGAYPLLREVEVPAWEEAAVVIAAAELEPVPEPSPWPWVVIGVGAAATATGIGLTVTAGGIRDDYDADWDPEHERYRTKTEAQRVRDQARIDDLETGSAVAFGIGAALVVGGLVWWFAEVGGVDEPELQLWGDPTGGGVAYRF